MTNTNGTPEMIPDTHSEVRNYLERFGNKDPHEMLGVSNDSGLRGAMVIATVATAVLFAALTFIPYFMSKTMAKGDKPAEPTPAAKVETPKVEPKPAAPATTAGKKAEPANTAIATPPKGPTMPEDFPSKLKENEVKTAPAKVNPLLNKNDDLLNDIK